MIEWRKCARCRLSIGDKNTSSSIHRPESEMKEQKKFIIKDEFMLRCHANIGDYCIIYFERQRHVSMHAKIDIPDSRRSERRGIDGNRFGFKRKPNRKWFSAFIVLHWRTHSDLISRFLFAIAQRKAHLTSVLEKWKWSECSSWRQNKVFGFVSFFASINYVKRIYLRFLDLNLPHSSPVRRAPSEKNPKRLEIRWD